jgi:hypothetical protein
VRSLTGINAHVADIDAAHQFPTGSAVSSSRSTFVGSSVLARNFCALSGGVRNRSYAFIDLQTAERSGRALLASRAILIFNLLSTF